MRFYSEDRGKHCPSNLYFRKLERGADEEGDDGNLWSELVAMAMDQKMTGH